MSIRLVSDKLFVQLTWYYQLNLQITSKKSHFLFNFNLFISVFLKNYELFKNH
jgi:hypothetical protein